MTTIKFRRTEPGDQPLFATEVRLETRRDGWMQGYMTVGGNGELAETFDLHQYNQASPKGTIVKIHHSEGNCVFFYRNPNPRT